MDTRRRPAARCPGQRIPEQGATHEVGQDPRRQVLEDAKGYGAAMESRRKKEVHRQGWQVRPALDAVRSSQAREGPRHIGPAQGAQNKKELLVGALYRDSGRIGIFGIRQASPGKRAASVNWLRQPPETSGGFLFHTDSPSRTPIGKGSQSGPRKGGVLL